jgi:hypothetical protein
MSAFFFFYGIRRGNWKGVSVFSGVHFDISNKQYELVPQMPFGILDELSGPDHQETRYTKACIRESLISSETESPMREYLYLRSSTLRPLSELDVLAGDTVKIRGACIHGGSTRENTN